LYLNTLAFKFLQARVTGKVKYKCID
jgi:hypothetical protein